MEVNENDLGTPVEPEEIEHTDEDRELEATARRMGWRPKEEFDRPPARWVDAKTFVDRGLTELPIVRERYRKLDTEMAKTSTELGITKTKVEEQSVVINEMREMLRSAEDRAYVKAMRELSERERAAVEAADTAAYDRVQIEKRDFENLRTRPAVAPATTTQTVQTQTAPPVQTQQIDPEVSNWVRDNPWFTADKVLNSVAIAFDAQVKEEHPDWSVGDQLAEAKRLTVARFPEKFANARRAAPNSVATSSATSTRPKKKTVKDLGPDFEKAFDRFQRMMPGYTEEEYLKTLGEMS